ncbi:MAG: phosphocholine cytidylyltransferase family protein [Alphaproteobacteria bacterium]|nr:phosphocholine cytidylyltransferase family protein [Alphaproteobacteria bacterium]
MVHRAVILAAGVGARLGAAANTEPKALLRFAGRTLLERHLANLAGAGIRHLTVVTGFARAAIEAGLAAAPAGLAVETVHNPDFTQGSGVSLWTARAALAAGGPVLLMDADVLYDPRMIARLVATPNADCFLVDRDFVPGPEPVKLCIRGGRIVEFRKAVAVAYDWCGESVGFFRLSPAGAAAVIAAAGRSIAAGRVAEPYEEAIRTVALTAAPRFGWEDVTGLRWIEIDFPEDVVRAEREILPVIESPHPMQMGTGP